MGVHRTKRDKQLAQLRREQEPVSAVTFSYSGTATAPSKQATRPASAALDFDASALQYLKRDLFKTAVTSAIIVCCLIGIYWYLRYNEDALSVFSFVQ